MQIKDIFPVIAHFAVNKINDFGREFAIKILGAIIFHLYTISRGVLSNFIRICLSAV